MTAKVSSKSFLVSNKLCKTELGMWPVCSNKHKATKKRYLPLKNSAKTKPEDDMHWLPGNVLLIDAERNMSILTE